MECIGTPAAKARLVAAGGDETLRTRVFDIAADSPWPPQFTGRVVANDFSCTWHGREPELAADPGSRARYAAASAARDVPMAVVWAGEAVDLIRTVEPAGAIVARIVHEAEAALARRFD